MTKVLCSDTKASCPDVKGAIYLFLPLLLNYPTRLWLIGVRTMVVPLSV